MEKTYSVEELAKLDTDAWVEAMSALDDLYLDEVLAVADDESIVEWARNSRCPAQLESEFNKVARLHKVRFNADGEIVSHID